MVARTRASRLRKWSPGQRCRGTWRKLHVVEKAISRAEWDTPSYFGWLCTQAVLSIGAGARVNAHGRRADTRQKRELFPLASGPQGPLGMSAMRAIRAPVLVGRHTTLCRRFRPWIPEVRRSA